MYDPEKKFYNNLLNKVSNQEVMQLVVNNSDHRDKIKTALKEMSGACTRIEAEKDFIKDVLQRLKDEIGIEPKIGRKLLKHYYNQDLQKQVEETEEIEELYTSIFDN